MRKVFLSGYAKLPDHTTAQKLYTHLVLVATVELPQGTILDADCTMATQLGREFIRELLTGYDLHRGPGPAIEALNHTYYGHLRRALQTCIKGICTQFGEISRSEAAAPRSPPIHDVRRNPHAAVRRGNQEKSGNEHHHRTLLPSQLNPNSYNLRLSMNCWCMTPTCWT